MSYFNSLTIILLLASVKLVLGSDEPPPPPTDPPESASTTAPPPTSSHSPLSPAQHSACNLYKYVGVNDLSINDVVVKSSQGGTVCIKARFSLAIKVEALLEAPSNGAESLSSPVPTSPGCEDSSSDRMVLGYLPLDSVIYVEDSCPETQPADDGSAEPPSQGEQSQSINELNQEELTELSMSIRFDCGKMRFNFKRDNQTHFLASIRGSVHLDSITTSEFVAEQSMFLTSDLNHHFKFSDLIEVNSSSPSAKGFILTANFYNSEFEAFRNTTSRSFIRPPDANSRPFNHDNKVD